MKCFRIAGWASLACLLLAPSYAGAQTFKPQLIPGDLAGRLRWVQFDILGGRIHASSEQFGTTTTNTITGPEGRRERLSIDLNNLGPSLRYELADRNREITIEVTDGDRLVTKDVCNSAGGKTTVVFTQVPLEDLKLSVEDGRGKRTIAGPAIWHLLLAEPDVTKDSLGPTLELLRPGWKLAAVAHALEEALFQNARVQPKIDRQRWDQLVAATSSPRFAERERAERELLAVGREILPYLRGLSRSDLDSEQWRRVQAVMSALEDHQGDSVEQTVSSLAGDPRAWFAVLNHEELRKRQLAYGQISVLTGRAPAFDPSAGAEERAKQWLALQDDFKK